MNQDVTFSTPPAISVAWTVPAPLQISLPGGIATRGERGLRGATFLGSYPTRAALPSIAVLSDALALGDFAYVQDEGLIVKITA